MRRIAVATPLLLLSTACAQFPRAEIQAYGEAFTAAHAAAEPLIADYAIRERADRRARLEGSSTFAQSGYHAVFDPADVVAVSSLEPPPGASALERGFRGIASYNDTLVALAEGRNIEEARAQLREAIGDFGGVASMVAPGAAGATPVAQEVAGLIVTLLSPAIQMDNRAQFKRIVLDGYPHVRALIAELRDFTPTQYSTITTPLRERWTVEEANRPQIAAEINTWHRAFADYVALLNALDRNLTALHAAMENPDAAPLLARVRSGSGELRAYAELVRRSVADIRAPR